MRQVLSILAVLVVAFGSAGLAFAESTAQSVDPVLPIVELVNINEADAKTLATVLQRVGLTRAQAIVEWRESNGKFTDVEQLLEIKGIGKATLELNRERILL